MGKSKFMSRTEPRSKVGTNEEVQESLKPVKVLKHYRLYCPPHCDVKMYEGDPLDDYNIPSHLLPSLRREGVIQ